MRRWVLAAFLLLPSVALAQVNYPMQGNPLPVAPGNCSASVGTSAQALVPAGVNRNWFIQNVGSANVGLSWFSSSPSIGSAGTYTLAPGAAISSSDVTIPNSTIYAVAAAASTAVSCTYN